MGEIIASDKNQSAHLISAWPMYRALVGLGCGCAFLLALVFVTTKPTIQAKQAAHLEKAVLNVLPGAVKKTNFIYQPDGGFVVANQEQDGHLFYAGYNTEGELVGIAIAAVGMGYQDNIQVLYGYDPRSQTIVGMQVLASKETPGLGDKIETAPHFRANFNALDVALSPKGIELQNPVVAVKQGQKQNPWQIEGITGATISSKAIAHIIHSSASTLLTKVKRHEADFRLTPQDKIKAGADYAK